MKSRRLIPRARAALALALLLAAAGCGSLFSSRPAGPVTLASLADDAAYGNAAREHTA